MDRFDAILVDDDPWIRELWAKSAQRSGKQIRTFANSKTFAPIAPTTERNTPIFIDFSLNEYAGSALSMTALLQRLGFSRVFFATAHRPEHIDASEVQGIVGKEPPRWLFGAPEATGLTTSARRQLLQAMTVDQRDLFHKRMAAIYDAQFGSGEFAAASGLPENVLQTWEDGAYLSLSDSDLAASIERAWKQSK